MSSKSTRQRATVGEWLASALSFDARRVGAAREPGRLFTLRHVQIALRLALLLVLAVVGALLLGDRPGLQAEYFALGAPWEGKPLYRTIGDPVLETASDIHQVLATEVVFSVRWTGWWAVSEGGRHSFTVDADDGAYIRIDDALVIDSRGVFGEPRSTGERTLGPGFHHLEIGLYQTQRESRLLIHWAPPLSGSPATSSLPLDDLYATRPLALRQGLRRALEPWPRTYRRFLGAVLLLIAALMLRSFGALLGRLGSGLRARMDRFRGPRLRAALLLGLFALVFLASFPFTGTVLGGDDTAYLKAATFSEKAWFFSRYVHVYLLKLFSTLSGGDPILGVRVWWSFVLAVTVVSLAVAVGSVGPGLQLSTLTATLFVLFAQTTLFGTIGAGLADYSAMMFITAAVAVFMHGLSRPGERGPPRHEWHALAVGALTLAALRSKEVGAVLLLLPILFLMMDGRLDLRRFVRRIIYWTVGAGGALLILVLLDGWILDDFFYSFDSKWFGAVRRAQFPGGVTTRHAPESWTQAIWFRSGHAASLSLRNLWVGVVAAAVAAGFCRRRLELRLLHLLPIAYLLALIVLYIRMPHPTYVRLLIPILPVGCLMVGLLLHYAGLDEVSWKWLSAPRVLVPWALAAAVIVLVVVPYRMGRLEGADFLPVTALSRLAWKPESFVVGVLLPAIVLAGLSLFALVASNRRAWVVALLTAYLAFFGLGFEFNRSSLAKGWVAQKGDLLLYPWRTFRRELEAVRPRTIVLSSDLQTRYGMTAPTRTAIASVALRRNDLYVALSDDFPTGVDVAISSRFVYDIWRRQEPALAETAVFDPTGLLVMVRPREIAPTQAEPDDVEVD